MPSTQSTNNDVLAAALIAAVVTLGLSVAAMGWDAGLLGIGVGMVVMFIPALVVMGVAFPITIPLMLLIGRWLDRVSARKPA